MNKIILGLVLFSIGVSSLYGDDHIKQEDIRKIEKKVIELRLKAEVLEEKARRLLKVLGELDNASAEEKEMLNRKAQEYLSKASKIKERADDLEDKLRLLEDKYAKENLSEDEDENEKDTEFRKTVTAFSDTVQVITKKTLQGFLDGFTSKRRNSRQRGYGGGGGPALAVYFVNTEKILKKTFDNLSLQGKTINYSMMNFDVSKTLEPFTTMGGMGYGAIGNGVRIGGGGRGGSRYFNAMLDSTHYELEFTIGFGGVLLEKCKVKGDMNYFYGGILGGGSLELHLREFDHGSNDVDDDTKNFSTSFFYSELHSGATYSALSWLHLGVEFSAPIFISTTGFRGTKNNGFFIINPGFRFRIIFGNIG